MHSTPSAQIRWSQKLFTFIINQVIVNDKSFCSYCHPERERRIFDKILRHFVPQNDQRIISMTFTIELENGIPDACTFRNVIKEIDTQKLHELFCTDTCFVCRTNQAAIEPAGCLMAWDRLPPDVIDGWTRKDGGVILTEMTEQWGRRCCSNIYGKFGCVNLDLSFSNVIHNCGCCWAVSRETGPFIR